jgi:hypothetical protein
MVRAERLPPATRSMSARAMWQSVPLPMAGRGPFTDAIR